jgi:signal transduction histidine kinase
MPVEVRVTSVPLDGALVYVASIRSIAQRRALEASHRDFIAMVGHELRNLIGAIQGSAGIMNVKGPFTERRGDRVLRQTRQLERLIADLLDAHQLESGRLELRLDRSDLTALVRACVDEAAALSSSHALRVDAPEGPLDGLWDADRVMQVVRNLLSNAIKYSPAGGEVLITLAASEQMVDVSVADCGAGIAPEAVPRLFDRFYRAPGTAGSVHGMGVGLYVCKQLVEAHGGTISVASQLGEGTTITFRLPRAGPRSGSSSSLAHLLQRHFPWPFHHVFHHDATSRGVEYGIANHGKSCPARPLYRSRRRRRAGDPETRPDELPDRRPNRIVRIDLQTDDGGQVRHRAGPRDRAPATL